MTEIPLQKLSDCYECDVSVSYFRRGQAPERLYHYPAHRDDNYLFIIADEGYGSFEVDFHKVDREGRGFFHVCPGQVHSKIRVEDSSFWCVLISPHLVSKHCADVLCEYPRCYEHAELTEAQYGMFDSTLKMLVEIDKIPSENRINIRNALIDVFINLSVQIVQLRVKTDHPGNVRTTRKAEIATSFCRTVTEHIPVLRTVTAYAELMNISPVYLNEAVKEHTGRTPSAIIMEEIILEIKRQLLFSSLSVKEISYKMGYDETYLSRMFRKQTGLSPSDFRTTYIE